MNDLEEIRAWMHAHRDFRECIVDAIDVSDFGTTVTLTIDYIWNPDGTVRPDSDDRIMVELRLHGVLALTMHNRLNAAMLADLSALNWGFAEASRLEVTRADGADGGDASSGVFHRLGVYRESGPWIEAIFRDMHAGESHAPSPSDAQW